MNNRIEIRKKPLHLSNQERLLDLLVNDSEIPFFRDENGDIYIYLDSDGGWSLQLKNNGTWKME